MSTTVLAVFEDINENRTTHLDKSNDHTDVTESESIDDTINTIDESSSSSISTLKASSSLISNNDINKNENTAVIDNCSETKNKKKKKEKVGVTFCNDDELRTVYEIERLSSDIWFTDGDMMRIGISNSTIAMKIDRGCWIPEDKEETRRGLETLIEANVESSYLASRYARLAVLGEQRRQRKLGICADPELIAELYRTQGGTLQCQQKAYQIGIQDYKDTGVNAEEEDLAKDKEITKLTEKKSLKGKLKRISNKFMKKVQRKQ